MDTGELNSFNENIHPTINTLLEIMCNLSDNEKVEIFTQTIPERPVHIKTSLEYNKALEELKNKQELKKIILDQRRKVLQKTIIGPTKSTQNDLVQPKHFGRNILNVLTRQELTPTLKTLNIITLTHTKYYNPNTHHTLSKLNNKSRAK